MKRAAGPEQAMKWAREALVGGRYALDPHAIKQGAARGIDLYDIAAVLRRPKHAEAYVGNARHGGDEWRIMGIDDQDRNIGIGVEFYEDDDGRTMAIITVIEMRKRG